jgi:sec-independent protein translocase protein TatC
LTDKKKKPAKKASGKTVKEKVKPDTSAKKSKKKSSPQKTDKSKEIEKDEINLLAPIARKADETEKALTKFSDFIEEKKEGGAEEDAEQDPEASDRGDESMTVISHLDELRLRIMMIVGMLILFIVAGFLTSDYLLKVINQPFVESGQKLHIFTLTGGFMIRVKAAFGCGLIIGLPFIVYQLWQFIKPAVSVRGRMFSRLSILAAIILFYSGIAFVYFLVLPMAVKILIGFIGSDMIAMIGAENYLGFTFLFSIGMGLLFEFPIVVMVLTKIGMVTPHFLTSHRKHAVVAIWIISAFITPSPDPINQAIVAVPLMIFYEISILVSKHVYRKKQKAIESITS